VLRINGDGSMDGEWVVAEQRLLTELNAPSEG
jgi:hypothetical protein